MTAAKKKTPARRKKAKARPKRTPPRKIKSKGSDGLKNDNGTYTLKTKMRYIKEMIDDDVSANEMSTRTGISQPTLSRWLRTAREELANTKPKQPSAKKSAKSTGGVKVHTVVFETVADYVAAGGQVTDDGQLIPAIASSG